MRAMLLEQQAPIESSPLKLRDVADPIPGAGEVRIRVSCCAICRTDLHIIEGDLPMEKRHWEAWLDARTRLEQSAAGGE